MLERRLGWRTLCHAHSSDKFVLEGRVAEAPLALGSSANTKDRLFTQETEPRNITQVRGKKNKKKAGFMQRLLGSRGQVR